MVFYFFFIYFNQLSINIFNVIYFFHFVMDKTLLKRVFQPFTCLEMLVNLNQYRVTVGVCNNRNFNYKSNLKSRINRMTISYAVLNKENFPISKIIEIFLILVSAFLSLKYRYCNTARHFVLYILILTFMTGAVIIQKPVHWTGSYMITSSVMKELTSILVGVHLWPFSNFLLSIVLLTGDVEMNPRPKLISKKSFSIPGILIAFLPITILKYYFLKHLQQLTSLI